MAFTTTAIPIQPTIGARTRHIKTSDFLCAMTAGAWLAFFRRAVERRAEKTITIAFKTLHVLPIDNGILSVDTHNWWGLFALYPTVRGEETGWMSGDISSNVRIETFSKTLGTRSKRERTRTGLHLCHLSLAGQLFREFQPCQVYHQRQLPPYILGQPLIDMYLPLLELELQPALRFPHFCHRNLRLHDHHFHRDRHPFQPGFW